MYGIEMMLSRMIGKTPQELKEMSDKVVSIVEQVASDMQEMNERLKRIEERLNNANVSETSDLTNTSCLVLNGSGGDGDNNKRGRRKSGGNDAIQL